LGLEVNEKIGTQLWDKKINVFDITISWSLKKCICLKHKRKAW